MLSEGKSVSKKAVFGNDIEKSRPTSPISTISSSTATWSLGETPSISIPAESFAHKAFLRCSTRDLMEPCTAELSKREDESVNP